MRTTSYCTAALISALLVATPALANGYLFFHEHNEQDEGGTTYLGAVRDAAGRPVPGARIFIQAPLQNAIAVMTDARGRYRTSEVSKRANPNLVKVSASKPGYQQVKAVNMTRVMKPGLPMEINFTLVARQ